MMAGCTGGNETEPAAQAGRSILEHAPSAPGLEGAKIRVGPGEGRSPRQGASSLASAASNLGPFTATGETWVSGSVAGSYYNTQAVDSSGESLTEINSGNGKNKLSELEHHWTVSGITAAADLLVIVAHQSGSTDRDAFTFSYSTDGVNWTNAITVATTVTSSTRFEAPISLGGASTVYVRVRDTDRTAGAVNVDTLVVDYLAVDIKSTCGNGLVEGRETCDDRNTQSCDGCSASCRAEPLQNWYTDGDGDTYGNPASAAQSAFCAPAGKVSNNTDCNDANAAFNPGVTDVCSDGIDQNCDGVDQACVCGDGVRGSSEACDDGNLASCDGCSADCQTVESLGAYYPDADGDGFGSTGAPVSAYCASPGRAGNNTDCNDSAASIYPGAPDACSDGIDQDCNGQDRSCVLGSSCASNAECPTGFCVDGVCCENACQGGCQTCNSPMGSPGLCTAQMDMTSDAVCGAYTCSGGKCASSCLWMGSVLFDGLCSTGNYCSKSGTCLPKKTKGTVCSAANECTSGVCADGVCCDSACGGACDACNVAGREGTCSPRPAGSSGAPACAPFVCNGTGTACPTSCSTNADCIGDYFCEAGTCTTKRDIGQACTGSLQCASGFCVDGYCCNSSCNGDCDACDVPGSYGSCALRPAGTQGQPSCSPYLCDGTKAVCPTTCTSEAGCIERSSCDPATSTCTEASGFPNGETCANDRECQSSFCVDGVCCDTACGASCDACNLAGSEGVCTVRPAGAAGEPSCSPNLCGGQAQCATSCTSNSDCAGGLPCRDGMCAIPFALTRGWGGMESLDADNPAAKLRVYIETATLAKFHIRSSSSAVAVSLINPAGQEISVDTAAQAGILARHWDTSSPALALQGGIYTPLTERGAHVTFDIPMPTPGAWFVKLSARTRPVTKAMGAQVQLTTDGKAGTALVTDKQSYAPGEPVTAWLHVRDLSVTPPAPMSGATAKLSFLEVYEDPNSGVPKIPPKPVFKTLSLVDDGGGAGASGDTAPGDGIYTGRLTLTKAAKYIASAEVRGTDAHGHVWVRTSTNIIEVE
jgi:cysteine-rich repeat protein